ncbi:MAG: HAMP domain-containing histidine kinase [Phycisphaerales bacterium]|nr:HAMP domain-containing histidine kinase [Phycisphaerales bacterium]
MRLGTKLSIVLALLVLTLASNVALSVWSIRFLERELALPLRSVQSVMSRLHEIKRMGEEEIDLVSSQMNGSGIGVQETARHVETSEQAIAELVDELSLIPSVLQQSGISTPRNLRIRSGIILAANLEWRGTKTDEHAAQLIEQIDTRHELIERIEGRILEDAALSAEFGKTLTRRIYIILAVTIVGALAIGMVMVMFIRRWVFSPIDRLREGAERLALGDFDHKIRVHTNDELGRLGEEFNRMGGLIHTMQVRRIEQERLAAMGEMAQRTVHNLRTPLAGIRALSETTLDELPEGSDLADLQKRIIVTVDRFEGWLKEMVRTSAPLEMHPAEYNPDSLVSSVIEAHRAAAQSRGCRIEMEGSAGSGKAIGDAHHLEHAITAVLSNAVEYAPEGSAIRVRVGGGKDDSGRYWTVRIENSGEMIPEALQQTIFRPYFTTRKNGTGIGLALCHRVVQQHLGRIEIKSPLNASDSIGCAFLIQIAYHALYDQDP